MGLDLKDILPILARLIGKKYPEAAEFYKENKGLVDLVAKELLEKNKTVVTKPVADEDDGPAMPVVDGQVHTTPPPGRKFSGLRLNYFFFQERGEVIGKPKFDAILSGKDALNAKQTKIVLDIDPLDENGVEIGPGSAELAQLINADGSNKIKYRFSGTCPPPTIHQWDRDFGCRPALKNHFEAFEDNVDYTFSVQAYTDSGLESNWSKEIRVKR
jgi:hypothetical protein